MRASDMLTLATAFLLGLFAGGVFSPGAAMPLFRGAVGVVKSSLVCDFWGGDRESAQGLARSGGHSTSSSHGPRHFNVISHHVGGRV
jgi:hypothetical protein